MAHAKKIEQSGLASRFFSAFARVIACASNDRSVLSKIELLTKPKCIGVFDFFRCLAPGPTLLKFRERLASATKTNEEAIL